MAGRVKTRKWVRRATALLLLLVLVVVALPLWLPWVLPPVLRQFNVDYKAYHRLGYSRFAVDDLHYRDQDVVFTSRRAEVLVPTVWAWHHLWNSSPKTPTYVLAQDWSLRIQQTNAASGPPRSKGSSKKSTYGVVNKVHRYIRAVHTWVPAFAASNGTVAVEGVLISIPTATWRAGSFHALAHSPAWPDEIVLDGDLRTNHLFKFQARSGELSVGLELARREAQWNLQSTILWLTNDAKITARFAAEDGWLPGLADLTAEGWQVPGPKLGLDDSINPEISARFTWQDRKFELHSTATAAPSVRDIRPRVHAIVSASGDLSGVTVNQLDVEVPGVTAKLSAPVRVERTGNLLAHNARLEVQADLARLPGLSLLGHIDARLDVAPQPASPFPRVAISLHGTNAGVAQVTAERLELAAEMNWPRLEIASLDIRLADDSPISAKASIDLDRREILAGQWQYHGHYFQRFLPPDVAYATLHASGSVTGALERLQHEGVVQAGKVTIPPLKPTNVKFAWRGEQTAISHADIAAVAGDTTLTLAGSGSFISNRVGAEIATLSLAKSNRTIYALASPAQLYFAPETLSAGTNLAWRAGMQGFSWMGDDREITAVTDLAWPQRGNVSVTIRNLGLEVFGDFLDLPQAPFTLSELTGKGHWDSGPLTFHVDLQGSTQLRSNKTYSLNATLAGGPTNLVVDRVILNENEAPILTAHGRLPITISPSHVTNLVAVRPHDGIEMKIVTATNRTFWAELARVTGLELSEPSLQMDIGGTLATPVGQLQAKAAEITWRAAPTNAAMPRMEKLDLEINLARQEVRLSRFDLLIENQPVHAMAALPLAPDFWPTFLTKQALPDWTKATGQVQVADAELEPFAHYFPRIIVPQGRVGLSLNLLPGMLVDGYLQLTNAATRPLPSLGPLRDIHARVEFNGQSATIRTLSAMIGGQPVEATGNLSLAGRGLPFFDLRVIGHDVPLVRQPGSLIRSDLDLRFRHQSNSPVVLGGRVGLRNSLFLQEIKSLIPGGLAQPAQRPPYFSIAEDPFADWKLDLTIEGDRFLKVRSPLFRGEISADLKLQGTLEEPMALGEIRVAEGAVQFPFGSLAVQQGLIDLTSENPYDPELLIIASSRVLGYNVKIEISGTATDPAIAFSSTPPLNSEQIVLMLTAGELPRDETTFSSQQKAGRLALYLGRDMFSRLVGSEDAAERLTVRSGERVSEEGDATYYLEYKLNDKWSVTGEYDRFNALNGGLKWNLYSK